MPRIELIEPVLYSAEDPIHWEVDNLPLKAILRRQNLINLALDDALEQLRDAIGTQGSVANRLNQSINPDGSLKTTAIDQALHSIEEHEDTDDYVRMTRDQSEKLDLIADEATDVVWRVYTDATTNVLFDSGELIIKPSTTVTPSIEAPNVIKLNLAFPETAAHQHHYSLNPVHANIGSPDYQNYKVNGSATPFVEDSLRVFINGVRIFDGVEVYTPGPTVDDPWTLLSFDPDHDGGTFELSEALTVDDVIRIDFDIALV